MNAEDFVPRMGAYMRLGVDMVFVPDEAFRSAYYGCSPMRTRPTRASAPGG